MDILSSLEMRAALCLADVDGISGTQAFHRDPSTVELEARAHSFPACRRSRSGAMLRALLGAGAKAMLFRGAPAEPADRSTSQVHRVRPTK
jgi:hypothetical protein